MTFYFSHHIGNVIIPTDSYFSEGVAQPPTRYFFCSSLGGLVSPGTKKKLVARDDDHVSVYQ